MSGSGVLVTGATGTTGTYICEYLADAGARVVAASRGGAGPHGSQGVRFDWHDPATFDVALVDVDRMYVIAPSDEADPLVVMRPFLTRARAGGVGRAVLQSSSILAAGDPGLGRVHAAIAEMFPDWAVLRPSWFMQNFSGDHPHGRAIRERGVITTATGKGRVGFIDVRDIARVAARVLVDDVAVNGDAILTGPEALSYDDVAAILSRTFGRAVTHVDAGEDRMREIYSADGTSDAYAAMLATLDGLIARGAEDRVTDHVLRLSGTAPTSFAEFASEMGWA